MKKRRLMLCSIISLIMVFVMAVPMTVSADTATEVASKAELVKALSDGATSIKLTEDIVASITIDNGKNVTIDLNGKTLTGDKDHTIANAGVLTVVDSSNGGKIVNNDGGKGTLFNKPGATATLKGGTFTGNTWYVIKNLGSLTIEAGTNVRQNDAGSSSIDNGWYNAGDSKGHANDCGIVHSGSQTADLVIAGGEFSGGMNTIKNDDYGTLKISDGTFSNTDGPTVLNWNVAEISGGSFTVNNVAKAVLANGGYGNEADQGKLTVTGGKFTASNDGKGALLGYGEDATGGSVSIKDGTFNGSLDTKNYPYHPVISGGDFTDDPGQYVHADENAVLVFEDDDYRVIYNDDLFAGALGAVYKNVKGDVTYYYFDKDDVAGGKPAEQFGYSVDFYAMQPDGTIDENQNDYITVPDEMSVNKFLAELEKEGYEFNNKPYAIADPKAVDGYKFLGWYNGKAEWNENDDTLASFAYGEKFNFDQKITKNTEVFAAWEKVGSGSNEPTQPGNLDKPSKDNGAVAKADKSAKTGDNFNLFAVGGVALAAIIAMAAVAITGRRHRQR